MISWSALHLSVVGAVTRDNYPTGSGSGSTSHVVMTATGAVGDLLGELGRMYQDSQYLVQPSESLALVG